MIHFTFVQKDGDFSYTVHTPDQHMFFFHNICGSISIDIRSQGAEVYLFGLYIGRGNDRFDIKTTQRHTVGGNSSDLLIKGIFTDESKFIYEGLIQIEPHAQHSNAYQRNQNLLLSPNAFVDSRPFLEIKADDVRCTHGSTTGKLDRDQLLYAETRSISPDMARKLLLEGFIDDIFQNIKEKGYAHVEKLKRGAVQYSL